MYGNGGDDVIYGRGGIDNIFGGDGNDVIVGGVGVDVLFGGAGADTFRYVDDYDSKNWGNLYDTIEDFNRGQGDKIDLRAIDANVRSGGDQAFDWSTGAGEGNLWTKRVGADLFVYADIDGSTLMAIKLDDFSGQLSASDFIL